MSKLIDFKSQEAKILRPIFQETLVNPFIVHIVESFIYKEVINRNKDGIVIKKYNTKNDKMHGLYQAWHPNGQLSCEQIYKDGKMHGLYQAWNSNGQLSCEQMFKDGKPHGKMITYNEDGTIKLEMSWLNGKIVEDEKLLNFIRSIPRYDEDDIDN
jgi:antitoxin component YwqK of YwqJK toxin-antitoxin module